MNDEALILASLQLPAPAIAYSASRRLAGLFRGRFVLEGERSYFDLERYAAAGHCEIRPTPGVHNQLSTTWDEGSIHRDTCQGWFNVRWREQDFGVLLMSWLEPPYRHQQWYWIMAKDREAAETFFSEVCEWCSEVRGEILVFAGGCWQRDTHLYEAIQTATFDNLVLPGSMSQDLRGDIESFFAARETYEEHGVPWKRGILFLGPPGNGKTHAVKALLNALGTPCLYVKSFKSEYATDHDSIREVFKRARATVPCILVLEDLDSLVDGDNRAFFLNELDGFAANTGIVTLATTNHPERLDPAILDRPSRFDRKYHFELPGPEERRTYLAMWNTQLRPAMRLDEDDVKDLAARTEDFSYAYLKELVLSSMMAWISAGGAGRMLPVMDGQVEALRIQMSSVPEELLPHADGEPDVPPGAWRAGRRGRRRMG